MKMVLLPNRVMGWSFWRLPCLPHPFLPSTYSVSRKCIFALLLSKIWLLSAWKVCSAPAASLLLILQFPS